MYLFQFCIYEIIAEHLSARQLIRECSEISTVYVFTDSNLFRENCIREILACGCGKWA